MPEMMFKRLKKKQLFPKCDRNDSKSNTSLVTLRPEDPWGEGGTKRCRRAPMQGPQGLKAQEEGPGTGGLGRLVVGTGRG